MDKLEVGKLYQLKMTKGWVIAEYVREVEAHSYKYHNLNMANLSLGTERIRTVPLSHMWKKIRSGMTDSKFTVEARGMQVRPVTQDALEVIANLKREISRLDAELSKARQELREFCN